MKFFKRLSDNVFIYTILGVLAMGVLVGQGYISKPVVEIRRPQNREISGPKRSLAFKERMLEIKPRSKVNRP